MSTTPGFNPSTLEAEAGSVWSEAQSQKQDKTETAEGGLKLYFIDSAHLCIVNTFYKSLEISPYYSDKTILLFRGRYTIKSLAS